MFWNAGGFSYVKIKHDLYVTASTKKVIEVGKNILFSFEADFVHFFDSTSAELSSLRLI